MRTTPGHTLWTSTQNSTSTTSTNNWLNPYASQRQNYGISQFNVGNRFVGYVVYNLPNMRAGNALKYVTNDWELDDTFQMQNGLPFSAQIGSGFNSAAALNSSWNGAPSVFYIPLIGINTYQVPRAIVDDIRLAKGFHFGERFDLKLQANMYNVANHQNFTTSEINQNVYNFGSSTGTIGTTPSNPVQLTYLPTTFQSRSGSNNSASCIHRGSLSWARGWTSSHSQQRFTNLEGGGCGCRPSHFRGGTMIFGAHFVMYSQDAEADRAFLRDVLGLASVDAGHGWLIFALPPAEAAVHPAAAAGAPELYLMCDDLRAEIRALEEKGVRCTEVREERWGSVTGVALPGGGQLGLYQPRHPTALGLGQGRAVSS